MGAVRFNGGGAMTPYQSSSSTLLNLPDGDWSITIKTTVTTQSPAGASSEYTVSTGNFAATGAVNVYFIQTNNSTDPGHWKVNIQAGAQYQALSTSAPGMDSLPRLITVQRNGNNLEIWFCIVGQSPVQEASVDVTGIGALNGPGPFVVGERASLANNRAYRGLMSGVVLAHSALSTAQMEMIANGFEAHAVNISNLIAYWGFQDARATMPNRVDGSTPLTANPIGTSEPDNFPFVELMV